MKRPAEAIDKILTGLRNAEAPLGMPDRILQAVELRALVPHTSGSRLWNMLSRPAPTGLVRTWPPGWSLALAGFLGVSLAITAVHRYGQRATPQSKLVPIQAGWPQRASARADAQVAFALPPDSMAPAGNKKVVRTIRQTAAAQSVLPSEMSVPSHPAPEAPLTREEILLLRIVHKGDPQELAMLNPDIRAKQEAEGEAEFLKFAEESYQGDHE